MHPEAIFLLGYALTLVAIGAALEALGRRSTDPWASKVLAANRPPDADRRTGGTAPWLHSEVPAFHVGLCSVALVAALVLATASTIRHHRPIELAVGLGVLSLIAIRAARLMSRHRARRTAPIPSDDP